LTVGGRVLRIEYAWLGDRDAAPVIVFLHDGLGSLAMWKDYPQALCRAAGARGLVFSREGYGRSTPRAEGERWPVTFMHRQAHDVLPALFAHLGIVAPPWLFGHSDGGSIALLFAAAHPARVAGVVAVAPHVFVEDVSVSSIDATRATYVTTDLRARLARYHDDPDSAFWGWNDIWLDPAFRAWNIEDVLPAIACPVLAVQGEDDEYGTMAQVDRIARVVPQARVVKLPACGHSPHRDQPAALTAAVVAFLREHGGAALRSGDGLR
jgi:pimeloyl-ACP methyl ester carboxylesterase